MLKQKQRYHNISDTATFIKRSFSSSFALCAFIFQILIGCYMVMGFMQGYQPIASYMFGPKEEKRFHQSIRFALQNIPSADKETDSCPPRVFAQKPKIHST